MLLPILFLLTLSGAVHTGVKVHGMDSEMSDLGFSLYAALFVYHIVATSDVGKKSEMEVSANWCITIQKVSVGDAWGFSSNTPITLSRDFSVETLTGVTPS